MPTTVEIPDIASLRLSVTPDAEPAWVQLTIFDNNQSNTTLYRKAQLNEVDVLSIDNHDLDASLDEDTRRILNDAQLEHSVLDRARDYIWASLENTDIIADAIQAAADNILEWNHLSVPDKQVQDEDD